MTWRWATSFNPIILALAAGAILTPLRAGEVTGRVELTDAHATVPRPHADYSGVVVSLRPVETLAPVSNTALQPMHAVMTQKNKTFTPHMLPITVGSTVSFPNLDPIFHNAFSNYNGQIFDLGLYAPNSSRSVTFKQEGVVRVFCNIHSSMSAMIIVLSTPYFAVSQRDGSFRIAHVPPGDYQLRLVHERATEASLEALSRRIKVPEDGVDLGALKISETGHTMAPHKDKYGHDYRPEADGDLGYPETSK